MSGNPDNRITKTFRIAANTDTEAQVGETVDALFTGANIHAVTAEQLIQLHEYLTTDFTTPEQIRWQRYLRYELKRNEVYAFLRSIGNSPDLDGRTHSAATNLWLLLCDTAKPEPPPIAERQAQFERIQARFPYSKELANFTGDVLPVDLVFAVFNELKAALGSSETIFLCWLMLFKQNADVTPGGESLLYQTVVNHPDAVVVLVTSHILWHIYFDNALLINACEEIAAQQNTEETSRRARIASAYAVLYDRGIDPLIVRKEIATGQITKESTLRIISSYQEKTYAIDTFRHTRWLLRSYNHCVMEVIAELLLYMEEPDSHETAAALVGVGLALRPLLIELLDALCQPVSKIDDHPLSPTSESYQLIRSILGKIREAPQLILDPGKLKQVLKVLISAIEETPQLIISVTREPSELGFQLQRLIHPWQTDTGQLESTLLDFAKANTDNLVEP